MLQLTSLNFPFCCLLQLRICSYHTLVHTWTQLGQISGMVLILQLEVHPLDHLVIVHSISGFRFHSSFNLKLAPLLSTINLASVVSLSLYIFYIKILYARIKRTTLTVFTFLSAEVAWIYYQFSTEFY